MKQEHERFWKLLEPEYTKAMMFCRKLTGDRDRGNDLYQDALIKAYGKFTELRESEAFRPWLYRIILNTFRSSLRQPWFKRRTKYEPEIHDDLHTANPQDRHDATRWLASAFQKLSTGERALVTLFELEEWTIGEIATLLKKSEGSIKTKLYRVRQKLKKHLIKGRMYKRSAATDLEFLNGATNALPRS